MKKIEAFIKPFTLAALKEAFADSGVEVFRIVQAHELSSRQTHAEVYRGTEYEMDVTPRVLIVAIVEDRRTDSVVKLVQEHCQTDNPNDGWIVVSPIEQLMPVDARELESQ